MSRVRPGNTGFEVGMHRVRPPAFRLWETGEDWRTAEETPRIRNCGEVVMCLIIRKCAYMSCVRI